MSGSSFGKNITVTTFGESHGAAIGVVIDGFPAGMQVRPSDIQAYLNRRKPGASNLTTCRAEEDLVEILSGVFEDKTTGTPIALLIRNTAQDSRDYREIAGCYRPGHADYTYDCKYGFRDYRGGGRSSGRETAARVAAGALCAKLLSEIGIRMTAYTKSIGPVQTQTRQIFPEQVLSSPTGLPEETADQKAGDYVRQCQAEGDSVGGVIECRIDGVPAGIGDPVFCKLDAMLAQAIMSIGAVKAVEIGDGMLAPFQKGSENNDMFCMKDGKVSKTTNHSGGILGGISDGDPIILRAYIKPTPSIARKQQTVSTDGQTISIEIHGRHDPVIVPRAIVVVESMCAITLLDAMITNMSAKASSILQFYSK